MAAKVLIVEDDESVGSLEQMMAESHGDQVFRMRSGAGVLEELRDKRPDIIIMDVMMPKQSGLEAAQEVRKDPEFQDIPILFVSVLNLPEQFPEQLPSGPIAFLQKPFEMEDLLGEIDRLTAGR